MAENIQVIKQQRMDWLSLARITLARVRHTLNIWHQRRQTRRLLAQMPSHLLKDIGATSVDQYEESRKPFWKD